MLSKTGSVEILVIATLNSTIFDELQQENAGNIDIQKLSMGIPVTTGFPLKKEQT